MFTYRRKSLERYILLIVNTHGEGENFHFYYIAFELYEQFRMKMYYFFIQRKMYYSTRAFFLTPWGSVNWSGHMVLEELSM